MKERTYLLLEFGYDGSAFHGVMPQPGLQSVTDAIFARIEAVCDLRPKGMAFAARTDAGVWAQQNFATCWLPGNINVQELGNQISRHRNDGLLYLYATGVSKHIHGRSLAAGKHYRYKVIDKADGDLKSDPRRWQIVPECNASIMKKAARILVGTHDFSSFCARVDLPPNPVRTITDIDVNAHYAGQSGQKVVTIDVRGTSFLRKMVRVIVGTLVEVGTHLKDLDELQHAMNQKDRAWAGPTAPARGLTLISITRNPHLVMNSLRPPDVPHRKRDLASEVNNGIP